MNNPIFRSLANRQTVGYYAAFIGLGLYIATLGPTLPALAENTASTLNQISILFIARSFGYLVGSLLIGRNYDRLPGHALMAGVILVIGLMMVFTPILTILVVLAAAMLLLGMGEGALDVGGNTLLVWVRGDRVAPFMNGLHFFFGLGAFLAPIIIAQTIVIGGDIKLGYWILAFYALPVALFLLRTPNPEHPVELVDDLPYVIDTFLVGIITLFFFLYVSAEASFGGWIFTYTIKMEITDPQSAAYLTSAFWGALTLGRLISIPIAARFRPRSILITDMVGCLFSVGIILLFRDSGIAVWIGTIGMGLSMASIFPTMLIIAERRMTLTAKITRWFFVGAGLGGMFLPWVIGQYFERLGPQVTMVVVAIDLVLALIVLVRILQVPLQTGEQTLSRD